MEKYLYISGTEIAAKSENGLVRQQSEYINNYQNALINEIEKDKWKTTGSSAKFQHVYSPASRDILDINAKIEGVCGYNALTYLYSVRVGNISGIISKNYRDGEEQYILHSNTQIFSALDYNPQSNSILTCVSENNQTSHAAVFNIDSNNLNILTKGDSIDENISLSPFDNSILFNSRGIARTNELTIASFSNSSIFKVESDLYPQLEEILNEENFDLLKPKMDGEGNLYYIKKPYKRMNFGSSTTFADVLLFPFRLVFNVFRGLIFLSKIGFKDNKKANRRSEGSNPSVNPGQSERDLFIMGERINLEKQEKQNSKKEKTSGYAPSSFKLCKKSQNGEISLIRSGVFDYCFDKEGNIVYTNGKYVFKIINGEDVVLFKDKLITQISIINN